MRAQGGGGQNVNKVSSAIHLRFDISASSLPDVLKERLLALNDQRISKQGVLVIKAQEFRRQELNRDEAFRRLQELIDRVAVLPRQRRATEADLWLTETALKSKTKRGQIKQNRARSITEHQRGLTVFG